jgi:hypothetical protein
VARDWVDSEIAELKAELKLEEDEDGIVPERTRKRYADRMERYREVRQAIDSGEHFFNHTLLESNLTDGGDWPSVETFSYQFLWIVEALRWFLARVPAPVQAAEGQ